MYSKRGLLPVIGDDDAVFFRFGEHPVVRLPAVMGKRGCTRGTYNTGGNAHLGGDPQILDLHTVVFPASLVPWRSGHCAKTRYQLSSQRSMERMKACFAIISPSCCEEYSLSVLRVA